MMAALNVKEFYLVHDQDIGYDVSLVMILTTPPTHQSPF